MLNLSLILEESAKQHPTKTAFIFKDKKFSYTQINEAANKIANGLKATGIKAGDKVALTCTNIPAFPIIYYGIIKLGAIVVPLSVLLKTEEILYQLNDCDAKAYFCYTGTNEMPMGDMGHAAFKSANKCKDFFMIMQGVGMPSSTAATLTADNLMQGQSAEFEICSTNAEDTCVIIYTSGTTGHAKGAELTHSNLFFNMLITTEFLNNNVVDITLIALPLFHIFGMTVLMNAGIYKGNTNVLIDRFNAEQVFEAMEKHKVTIFAGVPTMFWALLNCTSNTFNYKRIAHNLKGCISGGASLPIKILEDFESRFAVKIWEGYGMSEGSPIVTFNQQSVGRKPGSVGKPVWGVDVKLVDTDGKEVAVGEKGELIFKGHNVMNGYYNKPEETAKALRNGWMHSGDIGIKDEDGFYYIVDRIKDMIVRAGFKVYPREIEEVIIKHESVSMVAVIGIPHEELGEEVKAYVLLKQNATVSEMELIKWAKENMAAYKYPRHVEFIHAMPMNATGKILKRELRK